MNEIWTEENLKNEKLKLKAMLEPFISKKQVELEISDDSKIYVAIKKEAQEEFEKELSIYLDIEAEDEDSNGMIQYSYIPFYDFAGYEEHGLTMYALAEIIEELGDCGEISSIMKAELEEIIEECDLYNHRDLY